MLLTCKKSQKLTFGIGTKVIINIMVFSNDLLPQHLEQIKVIFSRLNNSGLKVNAKKFILGINYMPYLKHIITQERVEPK